MLVSLVVSKNLTKSNKQLLPRRSFATKATPNEPQTVSELLNHQASQHLYRDVLQDPTQELRYTWAELNDLIKSFSHGLLNSRLSPKEKLAIYLPSELENSVLQLASARAGITYAVIPQSTQAENLQKALTLLNPKGFAISGRSDADVAFLRSFIPEINFWPNGVPYRTHQYPALRTLIQTGSDLIPGMIRFKDIRQENLVDSPLGNISPQPTDTAGYYFSSDLSKALGVTQSSLVGNSRALSKALGFGLEDRLAFFVPLDTLGGQVGLLAALSSSSFISIAPRSFEKAARNVFVESLGTLFLTADQLSNFLSEVTAKKKVDSVKRVIVAQGPGYGQLSAAQLSSLSSLIPTVKTVDTVIFFPETGALSVQQGVTEKSLTGLGNLLPGFQVKAQGGDSLITGPSAAQSDLISQKSPQSWLVKI
eukprot:TRINITY_DN1154_c0_g1_i1.p1 TRINITY_DN1154_c0_g1~~TRINITY_DN1154_c0_g1_i1.p1  ORF type:complete len:423 (-),score=131.17 TRINITY_DN1154_c0_g1_i1:226-1494(-)